MNPAYARPRPESWSEAIASMQITATTFLCVRREEYGRTPLARVEIYRLRSGDTQSGNTLRDDELRPAGVVSLSAQQCLDLAAALVAASEALAGARA